MKALNQKHINEAQSAGLKLVSRAPNAPNSMIYECPDCNENILIRVETVRKLAEQKVSKGYDCPSCKESNYHEQAKLVGLTVIGSVQNTHNLLYRFDDCGHEQEIGKQAVRNNKFKCQTCYQQQLETEANKRHLTVIGKGSSGNYYLYENIICGHRYELVSSHVRMHGIKSDKPYPCRYCLYDQRMSEAKAAGLLLYGESHKSGQKNKSYLYQAPCGHSLERRVDQIRNGDWRCQACVDTKLSDECEKVGLSLVGKGSDKAYRTYQFKDCGHVKEITTASVRNRTFHCDVCFWDDVDNVLTKRGLKIIGKGAKGDSRLFQFLDCGHVQDIELQKAKDGSFVCHECDDTFYTLPSNVYLLRIIAPDFEWLKLGYAKIVETRIRQYRLPLGVIAEPLAVLPTSTGEEALKIKKKLEWKYKAQKLSATKMKKWHRNSGFTECYPINLREALEHEIAKLQ
jgi:predicted RNA-binding Zn-ribbon protein involved in translation (DUF1610 family)